MKHFEHSFYDDNTIKEKSNLLIKKELVNNEYIIKKIFQNINNGIYKVCYFTNYRTAYFIGSDNFLIKKINCIYELLIIYEIKKIQKDNFRTRNLPYHEITFSDKYKLKCNN